MIFFFGTGNFLYHQLIMKFPIRTFFQIVSVGVIIFHTRQIYQTWLPVILLILSAMNKSRTLIRIILERVKLKWNINDVFTDYIGLPRPRPIPPGGIPICCSPWPLLGFFTVSSTLSSRQAASEAAVMALDLTIAGSLEFVFII